MIGNSTGSVRHPAEFDEALRGAAALLIRDPSVALDRAVALKTERPDPRAFRLVAAACRALGRDKEAAEAELEGIKFGFTPPLRSAVAAQQAGQSQRSKDLADDYLRAHPGDLLAMTIMAEAAAGLRQFEAAEAMLREVRIRAPAFPRAAILLANLLASQLKLRDAIGACEELLQQVPGDPAALRSLAELRAQVGDYLKAAQCYEALIGEAPKNSNDLVKYGQNLRAAGCGAESVEAFRRAIELSPNSGAAWWALTQYFPEKLGTNDCKQIERALADLAPASSDAGLLRIALSIIYDRRGDHEAAFHEISAVKEASAPRLPYDPEILSRDIDQLIGACDQAMFPSQEKSPAKSYTPIFIVGMPRSGSTLVERILGRHSKIEAVGELQVLPRLVAAQATGFTAGGNSLRLQSLPCEKLGEMAAWYRDRAKQFRRTDKPFFTDKHNGNWIHAGLIRMMFPFAKIIDVRRNALDCCWSVFKMMFGDAYANDQRHLARYFADYDRFMKAIAVASPGGILSVGYEALVDDVQRETRRILGFVGLDYEPRCAEFHLSDEPVATPSSEQVRRPLFRDGIGSAEPYRKWLGPLIEELGSLSRPLGS